MTRKTPARLAELEQAISKASKIRIGEIKLKYRTKSIVEARSVLWFVAHDLMDYGMAELGRIYGFDHTTVMHACKKIRTSGNVKIIVAGIKKACPNIILTPNGVKNWEF
jgi:chromosomal replication initiation ATPase DnaA